jgi:CRP-like cAMP-binding protein
MAAALEGVELFAGLPEKEIRSISQQAREVKHPAGKEIMVRGAGGAGFMVLLDGEAEAILADGRSRPLRRGDHFGEMALLDHEGRSASVKTRTEVTVAAIPEWEFKNFLRDHPEVSYRLLQTLSRRLREAEAAK